MGTFRAVKVLWRHQFESERPFEREFAGIRRFEPVSRSTGGLVHVLHVGRNEAEGYFYYVMELADPAGAKPISESGAVPDSLNRASSSIPTPASFDAEGYRPRTLRSELETYGKLSSADCIRVGLDVVSGLAQLHAHGLVHRDIKPGNIIFVHGRAKLADIGLVSVPGEGRTFVGTEGYIAPEGPGTPAADLYALGVVLFEASTGFGPERLPDAPSEWFVETGNEPALELHECILRACEGLRERRYQSANEMQADLALLQSGQSIRHMRALARRYAQLRLAGVVAGVMLACAAVIVLLANYRARLASESRARETVLRQQAQRSLALAETAGNEARHQLNTALYEEARALVLSKELGHRTRALEAIRRVNGATNLAELRRVAFAALQLPDLRLEREVPLSPDLTLAQLDPRFERIALGRGAGAITINSLPRLEVLQTLPATSSNPVFEARWSCDGRFFAVKRQRDDGGTRSDVEIWNLDASPRLLRVEKNVAFNSICFHPRQPALMLGYVNGQVKIFDLESNAEAAMFKFPTSIHAAEYSAQGDRFAVCYPARTNCHLAVCDVATGASLRRFEWPESAERIAWHPQSRWLSVAGFQVVDWNRAVHLISLEDGVSHVLGQHRAKTATIDFSPDGDYLMSGGWDNQLFCWDLRSQRRVFTLSGSRYIQFWRADTAQYALLVEGDRLEMFHFERPACLELAGNSGEGLHPGAFSDDGRWLAVPDDSNLWVWELPHTSYPARFPVTGRVEPFFSPDGSRLFVVGGPIENAHLQGWKLGPCTNNAGPPQLTPLVIQAPPRLNHAVLAGDELLLTSAEGIRVVNLTNLGSGMGQVKKIPSGKGVVSCDGRWLAVTYSYSPLVTIYRIPAFERVAQLQSSNLVSDVFFSPSADELTVIHKNGVELWDTDTWHLRRHEPGSPDANSYILYAPDGKGLWRVTNFHDAAFHERRTLARILPLPANVLPLALSRDGRQLAVSVDEQRVQFWDLANLRAQFRELALDWTE
jgi:WD40 repeat protein